MYMKNKGKEIRNIKHEFRNVQLKMSDTKDKIYGNDSA